MPFLFKVAMGAAMGELVYMAVNEDVLQQLK